MNYPRDSHQPLERAALGYLYANCSNCHGGNRPSAGMNLSTSVHDTAVADTQVYRTAVGQPLTRWTGRGYDHRIVPGAPEQSGLLARMRNRDPGEQMPPLGTEKVDVVAVWGLSAWVHGLE
jgi:mono/diheme cytochrome c family protein